jgi:hypothetical protein
MIDSLHNPAKRLEELLEMPKEMLSEDEASLLEQLIIMKKSYDEHDEQMRERRESRGYSNLHSYYDKDGSPMSLWNWSGYFNDDEYKTVKKDRFGSFYVSTVWLGLDHGFARFFDFDKEGADTYKPLIFETMIFCDSDAPDEKEPELHNYQERSSSLEEAKIGHKEACRLAATAAFEIWGKR